MQKKKRTDIPAMQDDAEFAPATLHDTIPCAFRRGIAKSNKLINAKYKSTILEEKIFYAALYAIQNKTLGRTEGGNYKVTIYPNELRTLTQCTSGSFYSKLEPAAAAIAGRVYGISDRENDRFAYISLVSRCEYEHGEFTIVFNEDQKKLLTELSGNFTRLPLVMLKLKNIYAFRLYELLRSECYRAGKTNEATEEPFILQYGLSELRLTLGVIDANNPDIKVILSSNNPDYDLAASMAKDSMYTDNRAFLQYVIKKAVNEINEMTDIEIEYATKKSGRQIKSIIFSVMIRKQKEAAKKPAARFLSEEEKLAYHMKVKELFGDALTLSEVITISKESEYDFDKIVKAKTVLDTTKTYKGNITGYIISAMREDYPAPTPASDEDEEDVYEISPDIHKAVREMLDDDFSDVDIDNIIIAADSDLEKIKNAIDLMYDQSDVKDAVAWIITAIKQNYQKNIKKKKRDPRRGVERHEDYDAWLREYTKSLIPDRDEG